MGYLRSEPTYFPCNVRLSRCSSTFWKWKLLPHCYLVATCFSHSLHCWENHLLEAFNRGARYRVATTLVKWSVRSQCYRLSFPMSTWNWISVLLDTNKPPASIRLGDRIIRNQWQFLYPRDQIFGCCFFLVLVGILKKLHPWKLTWQAGKSPIGQQDIHRLKWLMFHSHVKFRGEDVHFLLFLQKLICKS